MEIPAELLKFENPCPGQANGLPGYFFTQTIQMLLATQCAIGSPDDYPKDWNNFFENNNAFDFIVIGGGSSGSVIASRLSEITKWKILLVEAGEDPTFESDIPGFALSLPGRNLDWNFGTNQSEKSCLGMEGGICSIFQGKVLGGTSTINKMHYIRGNRADYDYWESLGNEGWGYDSILQYFKKSEKLDEDFTLFKESEYDHHFSLLKNLTDIEDSTLHNISKMVIGKYHSKAGLLSVNHFSFDLPMWRMKKLLFAAAKKLDVPYVSDINGKTQIGFSSAMGTIHEGNRGNSAKIFLGYAKRRQNLFVLKNAMVQKIIFEGKKVKGVKIKKDGTIKTFTVNKEVILSAGAVNSPRILLVSGIGPAKDLESLGIKVIQNLEGVGKNLQMHLSFFGLPIIIEKNKSKSVTHLQKLDAMYQFISRGTGFFGSTRMNDVIGFLRTSKNVSAPDIQLLHYFNHIRDYYTFNELLISLKIKNEIRDQFSQAYAKSNILLICPTLLSPKSKGRIELTSRHIESPLKIISNFLEEKEDMYTLIKGVRFILKLFESEIFQKYEPELLKIEINKCNIFTFNTDEYWECLIRHLASSMHDVAGTCKMGQKKDPLAVVDHTLKVYGIQGLRVADSSIMPTIIRGSTSIASLMIAEKISDMIKNEWKTIRHDEL